MNHYKAEAGFRGRTQSEHRANLSLGHERAPGTGVSGRFRGGRRVVSRHRVGLGAGAPGGLRVIFPAPLCPREPQGSTANFSGSRLLDQNARKTRGRTLCSHGLNLAPGLLLSLEAGHGGRWERCANRHLSAAPPPAEEAGCVALRSARSARTARLPSMPGISSRRVCGCCPNKLYISSGDTGPRTQGTASPAQPDGAIATSPLFPEQKITACSR